MSKFKLEKLKVPEIDPNKDPFEYTEIEKMIMGKFCDSTFPEFENGRYFARTMLRKLNNSDLCDDAEILNILKELLGTHGENAFIRPPFYCELDVNEIRVGDNTLFGPNVQVFPPTHPIDPAIRITGLESAKPVKIGKDCWIGGKAIILAGVTIGDGVTIGAGSVVTKDIESYSVAVGNPARVIKKFKKPNE